MQAHHIGANPWRYHIAADDVHHYEVECYPDCRHRIDRKSDEHWRQSHNISADSWNQFCKEHKHAPDKRARDTHHRQENRSDHRLTEPDDHICPDPSDHRIRSLDECSLRRLALFLWKEPEVEREYRLRRKDDVDDGAHDKDHQHQAAKQRQ